MTSKLTRDRLAEIAQFGFSSAIKPANDFEIKELARMVLSAMDSEPVAEVVSIYGDPEAFGEREIKPLVGIQQMPYGTKLYRHAQPAPVVPDGYVMVPIDMLSELRDWAHPEIEKYCEMWKGRRDGEFPALRKVIADADAMLAAAPQDAINALIPLVSRNEQEGK
ncbi:TPA: hypothetical protein ACTXCH_000109 [Klebsiella quasipneumoniae subsp. quasipneumoniae]